jgi:hypothetical protein
MTTRKRPPSRREIEAMANAAARETAILLSIAIQHGVDIEMIRAALTANRELAGDGVNWPPAEYARPGEIEPPSAA